MRVFDEIIQADCGFVLIGTGERDYEYFFRGVAHRTGNRAIGVNMFDDQLAHRIYAGSDFFLMPSMFEPCGLAQMIALRYGTLPIVRATGGLKDTVWPYNENTDEGNGFSFDNYNAHDMLHTVRYALSIYQQQDPYGLAPKTRNEAGLGFSKKRSGLCEAVCVDLRTTNLVIFVDRRSIVT